MASRTLLRAWPAVWLALLLAWPLALLEMPE